MRDLLLFGATHGLPQIISCAQLVQAILAAQAATPPPCLAAYLSLPQLRGLVEAHSGVVVTQRAQNAGALSQALHQLPSKLKLLPFGGEVWI